MVAPLAPSARERSLCVSVVSHGQGELVDRLLADLAALPPHTVGRVIVTVNLPDDAWQPAVALPDTEIELVRNRAAQGFAANHNQAFGRCAESHFAVVNPDIRLAGNPFPALIGRLTADASCALAVPVQVDGHGRSESFGRRLPTPLNVISRRLFPEAGRDPGNDAAQWVSGAFMVWRADAFRSLVGFDSRYFLYCEDVDICLRLQLGGGCFAIVDTAHVIHDAQRASRTSLRYLLQHLGSLVRLWSSPVFWRFLRQRRAPAWAT